MGWIHKNPRNRPSYHFNDFLSKIANLGSKLRFWNFTEFGLVTTDESLIRVYSTSLKISYNISIGCKSIFLLFLSLSKMFCRLSDNSIIFNNSWTFDPATSSDCDKSIAPRNGDICFNFVILSIFNESRISIFSVSGLLLLSMIRNYIPTLMNCTYSL